MLQFRSSYTLQTIEVIVPAGRPPMQNVPLLMATSQSRNLWHLSGEVDDVLQIRPVRAVWVDVIATHLILPPFTSFLFCAGCCGRSFAGSA